MTISLSEILRDAPFGLFGIRPARWNGASFVGTVARRGAELRSVELVYLDAIDGSTMGIAVSSIDGSAVARGDVEPIAGHLAAFVPRFDARSVVERMGRRGSDPFPESDFTQRSMTTMILGASTGAIMMSHRQLPLQLLRFAVAGGAHPTDVGIAAWRLDAITFVPQVERVDPAFAKELDAPTDVYPPSEWA